MLLVIFTYFYLLLVVLLTINNYLSFNQPVISITSTNIVDSFLRCKFSLTPTAEYHN